MFMLLTEAAPRSIETLGEAILNLSGQIDLPITLETSHYLFNISLVCIHNYLRIELVPLNILTTGPRANSISLLSTLGSIFVYLLSCLVFLCIQNSENAVNIYLRKYQNSAQIYTFRNTFLPFLYFFQT